jgi:hypothetical protein
MDCVGEFPTATQLRVPGHATPLSWVLTPLSTYRDCQDVPPLCVTKISPLCPAPFVWVPTMMHCDGLGQESAEGTKQCVAVACHDTPPLVVVYVCPESHPDATGVSEPPTTHASAEAHETEVSALSPIVFASHDVPPSEVVMTDVPPTATQVVPVEQAIALKEPTPVGTLYWAQVAPPLGETRTMPVLKVVSPTA